MPFTPKLEYELDWMGGLTGVDPSSSESAIVGTLVGFIDGSEPGSKVGSSDSSAVGTCVEFIDGSMLGSKDTRVNGDDDLVDDGCTVGFNEGFDD